MRRRLLLAAPALIGLRPARAALVDALGNPINSTGFSQTFTGLNVSGGTGYNNLTNWPSAANRPVYNAGTNTLSWIGPVGGGPSTANDTAQSRVLTASSDITVASNGQVIQGLAITGNVNLNGKTNGILRQCYIKWASGFEQIMITAAATGWLFEDLEVDGVAGGGFEGFGFVGQSCTFRRLNMHGQQNSFSNTWNLCTFVDCFIHALGGQDADGFEFYDNVTSGDVEHCMFDGTGSLSNTNSGLNLTNVSGGATGVTANNCAFANWPRYAICDGSASSSGEHFTALTNNGFLNNVINRRGGATVGTNSGNYVMATITSTSGAPINGTGQI